MGDTELKPCPFCGKNAKIFAFNIVGCVDQRSCGALVDWGHHADVEGPGAAWNTRVPNPAADIVDELRAALGWYGEQARLCRLIHSGGDSGRHNLQDDGGSRASAALAKSEGGA